MSMSPAEIRHLQLRRGAFGYRRKDVDVAVTGIADAFGEVWRQRDELEERNHELARELARHQEAESLLRKTLVTAERSADVMRADARRDAERIIREAEQRAREIVGEAHHERERIRLDLMRLEEREREFRARFKALLGATQTVVDSYEAESSADTVIGAPAVSE
jgi:cell division initiation protein